MPLNSMRWTCDLAGEHDDGMTILHVPFHSENRKFVRIRLEAIAQLDLHSKRILVEVSSFIGILNRNRDIRAHDVRARTCSIRTLSGRERIRLDEPDVVSVEVLDDDGSALPIAVIESHGFSAGRDHLHAALGEIHQQLVEVTD